MPNNIYDDAVETLPPVEPAQARAAVPAPLAPPPAPTTNPYDAILEDQDAGRTQALRTAIVQTVDTAPERAAQVQRLATTTGIPADVVGRHYDDIARRAKLTGTPFGEMIRDTPHLATWAADPQNAAVAGDDLPQLGALEWLVTMPKRAIAATLNAQRYGALRAASLFAPLSQADTDLMNSYKFQADHDRDLGDGKSWFRGALSGFTKLATFVGSGAASPEALIGAAAGGTIGGLAGLPEGGIGAIPGAIAGARFGWKVGETFGLGRIAFQTSTADAYDEYATKRDQFGQPFDPEAVRAAAIAVGAIDAGLMTVGGQLAQRVAGAGAAKLAGVKTTKALVADALAQPSVRAALVDYMKTAGTTIAEGSLLNVAMRAAEIMGATVAKDTGARAPVVGQVTPGNIDLTAQPKVSNADGSVSTVDSVSIGTDAGEVLLSRVTPDGRHLTTEQATAEYQKTGQHLGVFDSPASADAFAQQLHADYAAGKYEKENVKAELWQAAVSGIQQFALVAAGGPLMGFVHDVRRAQAAEHAPAFFEALGEGVANSKTAQRLPEAAQAFIHQATADGPVATLYAPIESWTTYWQSKGIDPAAMAAELTGSETAYQDAQQSGGDLPIPTARYATKLAATEHNAFFAKELRLGPDEMNGREAEQFKAELTSAALETKDTSTESPVRTAILAQLTGAGIKPETADAYAALYESAIGTMAARAGVDPAALYASYGLTVTRPAGAPPLAESRGAAAAAGVVDEAGRVVAPVQTAFEPERRQTAGQAPGGIERRNDPLAPGSAAERAAQMRAENPNIDQEAAAARARALKAGRGETVDKSAGGPDNTGELLNAPQPAARSAVPAPGDVSAAREGAQLQDRSAERAHAGESGHAEGGSVGGRPEPRGLPAFDEVFTREPLEHTAARLTPDVRAHVAHLLDELNTFQKTDRTWNWLEEGPKTGNAAGGAADVVEGLAGAPVYHDVLAFSPVNKYRGNAARQARGSRGDVAAAAEALLKTGDVATNLQEGVLRVAENRAAGQWADLSAPWLPPPTGVPVTPEFTDAAMAAIDEGLAPTVDLLNPDSAATSDALEPTGPVDTSFNIDEFSQSLFDALQPPDPTVDELTTGEQQPRLPGDAGAARDTENKTPQMDAPFALTPEVAAPRAGKQTTLFQGVFHGSPHKFEEFSLHAIGSGEGAQAYGWGLYFASKREVADEYRNRLAGRERGPELLLDGMPLFDREIGPYYVKYEKLPPATVDNPVSTWAATSKPQDAEIQRGILELASRSHWFRIEQKFPERKAADGVRAGLERSIANVDREHAKGYTLTGDKERDIYERGNWIAALKALDQFGDALQFSEGEKPGRTYKVEIPEDEHFLAWDKPASQQSPKVQAALEALGVTWKAFQPMTPNQWARWTETKVFDRLYREDIGIREELTRGNYLAQHDPEAFAAWQGQHQGFFSKGMIDPTGETIYGSLRSTRRDDGSPTGTYGPKAASEALAAQGVAGIRYLDGFSRSEGRGSSNYVVFDPKLAQITEYDQPGHTLTRDDVTAWASDLKARIGGDLKAFEVNLTQQGDLSLDMIAVDRGAQRAGLGSDVMRELTRFADLNGKRILLTPAQRDPNFGTTSRRRLVEFYKRFGFVENAGRHQDFAISAGMYRDPTTAGDLAQPDDAGARRGAIRFGPDRQFNIALFERADLSTFLHESGHFFLEVFTDLADRVAAIAPEARTPEQQQILGDHATLREFLTDEDHTGAGYSTKQHEQLARAFESYLMEGKAPSVALDTPFARFRSWLVGIYRSLKSLNVKLTPEVRDVFDRLLASDAAIADAQARRNVPQMFTTAESAGMSPTEFALYERHIADASTKAREALDAKLLRDVQREQTAAWKAQRADVRAAVETETHQRPEYVALAAIQKGTLPDGSPIVDGLETPPLTLSRQAIAEQFGAERAKRLPRGTTTTDGGLDPSRAAELLGFASGDALLTAIEKAPPMNAVIEQETARRMIEQHGSLLLDGTLPEKAQAAVANEYHDQIVRDEMRALGNLRRTVAPFVDQATRTEAAKGREQLRQAGRERDYERRWFDAETKLKLAIARGEQQVEIDKLTAEVQNLRQKARGGAATIRAGIPSAATIQAAAEQRLAALRVGDVKPQAFWSASRRAGQAALERAARQDFDGAITAKQQELFNLALYRQAQQFREDVADRVQFAQTLARKGGARAAIGKVGGGFLDQIDGLLDRFGIAQAKPEVLARAAAIDTWQAEKQGEGVPVDLPTTVLNGAFRQPYADLTVAQFHDVADAITHLHHLARDQGRTFRRDAADAFAQERDGLVTSIRAHNAAHQMPPEFGSSDNRKQAVGEYFASLTKLSILARGLDGSQDGGPMWESFIRRLNEASDARETRNKETGAKMAAILEQHYPGRERLTLSDRTDVPGVGSLSKEARLAVALNLGTETGLDRLLSDPSRKWNAGQIEAIKNSLDPRDWAFVKDTWQLVNSFWSDIAAKQERVTGLRPEKVEGRTIHTPYGDVEGAYYPLKYDGRRAPRAAQLELAGVAKMQMNAAYVRTTTARGFVETRLAHVGLPVRLDLGVVFQHLDQVIHDLTHHEMLIDATRLLRDRKVGQAIYDTRGANVYRQFTSALQDVATDLAPATDVLQRSANFLRSGMQIASLGLNVAVGFKHPMGIFNGAALIGPEWMAKGIARWVGDARQQGSTLDWIRSNSPMMRDRGHTATQDLRDLSAHLGSDGKFDTLLRAVTNDRLTAQTIKDGMLWHIGLMQLAADVPTWLGGYEKAMDAQRRAGGEVDETRAFRLADQAVLDSQGGGTIKDLAKVQRGNAYQRLFLTFYSYGARVFNSTVEATQRTDFKSPASVIKYLGNLSLLYVLPAAANAAMRQASGKVAKNEDAAVTFLEDVGKDALGAALNGLMGFRELQGPLLYGRDYTGTAGTQFFNIAANMIKQVKQEVVDEPLVKSVNDTLGVLLHYPSSQIDRTVAGWEALRDGRTENPLALITGGPPKAK